MVVLNGDWQYIYTGWIPDKLNEGKGILVIDQTQTYAGTFEASRNYLNNIDGLASLKDEYTVLDLMVRYESKYDTTALTQEELD